MGAYFNDAAQGTEACCKAFFHYCKNFRIFLIEVGAVTVKVCKDQVATSSITILIMYKLLLLLLPFLGSDVTKQITMLHTGDITNSYEQQLHIVIGCENSSRCNFGSISAGGILRRELDLEARVGLRLTPSDGHTQLNHPVSMRCYKSQRNGYLN